MELSDSSYRPSPPDKGSDIMADIMKHFTPDKGFNLFLFYSDTLQYSLDLSLEYHTNPKKFSDPRMFDTPFDCIVLDGTVVTAADIGRYDIGIKDGKIALLAPARALAKARASRVIDAEGAYVMVCSM